MKNKKIAIIPFILLFALILSFDVSALSFSSDKSSYYKGETIVVEGTAKGTIDFNIMTREKLEVTKGKITGAIDGNFSFTYKTSCNDPEGEWIITVNDSMDVNQLRVNVSSVLGKDRCRYLKIKFLSPSSSFLNRTDSFNITVEVTDAREKVNSAKVYFWNLDGMKTAMYRTGDGIYSFKNYYVKPNALLGERNLKVTAMDVGEEVRGGEENIKFSIERAQIQFDIIQPKQLKEFIFGNPLRIELIPRYPNNESVREPSLKSSVGDERFDLNKSEGNLYWIEIPTHELNNEIITITLEATDAYGNSGRRVLSLKPVGYWYFIIQQNAIFFVFPALFVIYILYLSVREGRIFFKRTSLNRRKKKLLILKEKLQDDYFNKQMITRKIFYDQLQEYDLELEEVDEKLSELGRKQELK